MRPRASRSVPPRSGTTRAVAAWLLLATAVALAAAPVRSQQWSASVSVASDYVVHGVSRSRGGPVAQADFGLQFDGQWWAGASATTMNLNPGRGPSRELGLWLGRSLALGPDWSLTGSLYAWRYAAQIPGLDYDYDEARLELAWRDRVRLGLAASPNYSVGTRLGVAREATSVEASIGLLHPLTRSLSLTAGAGNFTVGGALDRRFWYWGAGLLHTGPRVSLALGWAGSEPVTRDMFGSRGTGDRIVATLAVRLH